MKFFFVANKLFFREYKHILCVLIHHGNDAENV
jgi:hypothetical protein